MPPPRARILLVDDDEVLLRATERLLSPRFAIFTATTRTDALVLANRERPDLAIVDVFLGTESGLELVRELRRIAPMKIAVVSAHATIDLTVLAMKAGADTVLGKPASIAQILTRLHVDLPPELENLPLPSIELVRYEHAHRVLADCHGNVARAARALGIDRATLQRWRREPAPK